MDIDYKKYLKSLADFMVKEGYTSKPLPHVMIHRDEQDLFGPTANYDPEKKVINLWIGGRHWKDCLRSVSHELIHANQDHEGRLNDGAYSGDKITEDNKLIKLEEEAYLKGNIAFRKWTETMQKKGEK